MGKKNETVQGEILAQLDEESKQVINEVLDEEKAQEAELNESEETTFQAFDQGQGESKTSYCVLTNIWFDKKNRLEGTVLELTNEEYIKLSKYVQPIFEGK